MPRGHSKGSAFERKIAKEIVKAYKKQGFKVDQRDCWRSVLSGGHEMSYGDLRMSDKMLRLFPFAIECKHRKKVRVENFFMTKNKELSWVEQAVGGCRGEALTPVIVMRGNFGKILALVGPLSEVHDRKRAEIYFQDYDGPWQMMYWSVFLKRAIEHAKKGSKKAT